MAYRTPIKYNPLEQLSKFYGFGDDSNAGGMDGNSGGASGTGSGANGVGGSNDNGNTSDIGGTTGGVNSLGVSSNLTGGSVVDAEKSALESLSDMLSGLYGSAKSGLNDLMSSLGISSPQDPTADNNKGGFGIDNGTYASYMSTSYAEDGSASYNYNPLGITSDSITASTADGGQLSGGFVASNLSTYTGISASASIATTSVAQAVFGMVLGKPIASISPTAKALQALGIIDEKTSKTLQAVGLTASFMQGAINGIEAFENLETARQYGVINDLQAGILASLNSYSMYNNYNSFSKNMSALGFNNTTVDMADFGMSFDGDGNGYYNGVEINETNFANTVNSFIYYLNYKYQENDNTMSYDKMAGSIFFDNFMAGGDLYNPMNLIGGSLNASVGRDFTITTFAKQSILQNDYIGTVFTNSEK